MPQVFLGVGNSADILPRVENSRRIHILVQDSKGQDAFKDIFLMNFELDITSDFNVNKSLDHGFIYATFGPNPVYITISGVYHHNDDIFNPASPGSYSTAITDPEDLFNLYCISAITRQMFKITTNYSGSQGSVYNGYMVKFKKNPMGQDKLNGYSFSIVFICIPEDKRIKALGD